jgi:hypothetical protein
VGNADRREPEAGKSVAAGMDGYLVIILGIGCVAALLFGPGVIALIDERRRMRRS